MEQTFQFKIGLGYASEKILVVEIPMDLHDRINECVGEGKMARLEFGFQFQDFIKQHFPELDMLIHERIDEWIRAHYKNNAFLVEERMHKYTLQSPWYEDV